MSELRLGQDKKYLDKKAASQGLIVFIPEPNEVFLDLDSPDAVPNLRVMGYITGGLVVFRTGTLNEIAQLGNHVVDIVSTLQTTSAHGNTHLYIKLSRAITDLERVIFQVCLGSNPIKELFSFMQLKQIKGVMEHEKCECPVALFETQDEAKRVVAWRYANV